MHELTARRRDSIRQALADQDEVDALLVTTVSNVTYLTGFTGDSTALFLGRDGRDLIVSDGRYEIQLASECPGVEVYIRPVSQLLPAAIAEVADKLGATRLGIEAASLTVADQLALMSAAPSIELCPTSGAVETARMVKDDTELDAIRRAISIAERAFAMARAGLRPDDTEADTADALEGYLRHCGAAASSFDPIIAAGPNSALPHARPSAETRLGSADFVLFDWGASLRPLPYKSDLTRVVVTGRVGPEFEKVYATVLGAQRRAIAAVRPGALAEEIDAEARSFIEEAGFGRFFNHGLGHGIGLDIHEGPRLRAGSRDVLQPGMVITIEPGIYLPGWGGIRIEDDILVTPDGREVLSHLPSDLEQAIAG